MCRFLMVRFQHLADSAGMIESFARMCKDSRAPDGDRQDDGWGIAWLDGAGQWLSRKSIRPIWDDIPGSSDDFPAASMVMIHARSASFDDHKNNLMFNQPFISNPFGFVFNGLIQGIRIARPIPGKVGAQKIWYLLQEFLEKFSPEEALDRLVFLLDSCSRKILALNLGLCSKQRFYIVNKYVEHQEYYSLHMIRTPDFTMVCSEPLKDYSLTPVETDRVVCL